MHGFRILHDMGAPNVEYLAKKIENEVHSVLKKISSNGTQKSVKVCDFMKSKKGQHDILKFNIKETK